MTVGLVMTVDQHELGSSVFNQHPEVHVTQAYLSHLTQMPPEIKA